MKVCLTLGIYYTYLLRLLLMSVENENWENCDDIF